MNNNMYIEIKPVMLIWSLLYWKQVTIYIVYQGGEEVLYKASLKMV